MKPYLKSLIAAILSIFVFAVCAEAQGNWQRMELTGTGLSVESPKPFVLVQDKPDPLFEDQIANIFWKLSHQGIFATITYEKRVREHLTPRQKMESTAKLFAGQYKSTMSQISDTTFEGLPAALFEEEFFEPYAKQNTRRKMLAFGVPGELTTINFSWPVGDPGAKALSERIFNSVQKKGAVAKETPKMPPTDWRVLQFKGLNFETPSQSADPRCGSRFVRSISYESAYICYKWGEGLRLGISYRKYSVSALVPGPAQMAREALQSHKEIAKTSTLQTVTESSVVPAQVPGTEAVKLKIYTGYLAAGTMENIIYIKRGLEVWQVKVNYFMRWKFEEEASDRILSSLSVAVAPQSVAAPETSLKSAGDFYDRGLARYRTMRFNEAAADFTEAIRHDPNHVNAYIMRSKIYCAQKLLISALKDENKAISLGGKLEKLCSR